MCGRFNVVSDPLNRFLEELTGQTFEVRDQYNIAPTEQVPVLIFSVDDGWDLRDMRWWLVPHWADEPSQKYSMFNARAENLNRSRAFREPFQRRRCIVPASGYFEWHTESGKKIPYYITPRDDDGFAFAGLWDRWEGDQQVIDSCAIVTTGAPEEMQSIYHRIPVHLTHEQVQCWMSPDVDEEELTKLLAPERRIPLAVTPVSTMVNNARNKDAQCLEAVGETRVIE